MNINIRSNRLTLLSGLLLLLLSMFVINSNPKQASATYDGSRLIDDIVFLDSNSISSQEIQSFLVARGGAIANRSFAMDCTTAGAQANNAYIALGAPCGQTVPASSIIYYTAQVYGVNPRVIIATMQKEQSLITATNPTNRQYVQAMGYGCPTTGSCDDSSNFFWQVDNGTWVLRFHYERARGNMNWWYTSTTWTCGTEKNFYKPNLYPNQNVNFYDEDNVMYRTHFINNAATSAFYCYTPHAYNNPQGLYGRTPYGTTGRYYSGSYNFVLFYELWFGSTQAPDYSWQMVEQYAYKDQAKTIGANLTTLLPGDRVYVGFRARNNGNMTWRNNGSNPIRVGMSKPNDRLSPFYDSSWLGQNRPTSLVEASVAPGQVGTFEYWMTVPNLPGARLEYFNILSEGMAWFSDPGLNFYMNVR